MALRKILPKLALSAGSLLFLGLAAEVTLRALEPGPFSLLDSNPYRPHPDLHHVHEPDFQGRWDSTWYSIDSRGLRGSELELGDPEQEYRVACLGDSCTFGKGVREVDSWPRQLEALLETELAGGQRAVVANLGVNGYSGKDYVARLAEFGLPLEPDLVVVGYNLNDFPNAIRAVDEVVYQKRGLRRLLPTGLRDGLGRFALYRKARAIYYHLKREQDWASAEKFAREAGAEDEDSETWQLQRGFLEEIRDRTREAGGELVVFLFPYESQVYLDGYERRPIERLAAICSDLEIPFVDLAEEFRSVAREQPDGPGLFLLGDRYHPSATGYGVVAERVLELIRERGWLPG